MRQAYFKFMSAIDIETYKNIRDSEIGNTLSYSDILQIFIIAHKKDMTISELANTLNLSRPATTQKVNELVAKGFVIKRQSTEDKRVYHLSVSKELLENSQSSKLAKLMDKVDKNFSDDKKAAFAEILGFITEYILEE